MNLYKPVDYLYYFIGKTYEFTNEKYIPYIYLMCMITTIQAGSIIAILSLFIGFEMNIVKALIYVLMASLLLFVNLYKYNEDSYNKIKQKWSNESLKNKKLIKFGLSIYFTVALICFVFLVSNNSV